MKREETKKLEALFDEGNSIPFTIRIPKGLFEKLEEEAKKRDIPLSTCARDLLTIHFVPDILESLMGSNKVFKPDDYKEPCLLFKAFKDYVLNLDSKILEVSKYQRRTERLKTRLKEIGKLIDEKIDAAIREAAGIQKQTRRDLKK